MWAWWSMPFQKSAVIEVQQPGEEGPSRLRCKSWSNPAPGPTARCTSTPSGALETLKTRPFRDWTYCDLKGKGVFVGDMLSLINPVRAWWGEGDEKIFVDGETFPSWFGTGSEDYYGYAWSDPKPFQHPYHNQTRCDGAGQPRPHQREPLPHPRRHSVREIVPLRHGILALDAEHRRRLRGDQLLVRAARRHGRFPGAGRRRAAKASPCTAVGAGLSIKGALEGEKLKISEKSSDFDVEPAGHDALCGRQLERRQPSVGPAGEGRRMGRSRTAGGGLRVAITSSSISRRPAITASCGST